MRVRMSLVALALGLVVGLGCGRHRIDLPAVPAAVAAADVKVHAAAIKGLGISESLGIVAVDVALIEKRLAAQQVIPPTVHAKVQDAFTKLADGALTFNADVNAGVIVTWADLKARVDPLMANVQALINLLTDFKGAIGSGLDSLKKIGLDLLAGLLAGVKFSPVSSIPLEAR